MKSVILLSGGMDSAVLLADRAQARGPENVLCLSFDYGQKHSDQELTCAARLAKHYGVRMEVIGLPFMASLFRSALLCGGVDIPVGHYTDPCQSSTVVPGRNAIFASIAAGYAECHGAGEVLMGAHLGDAAIYADCRSPWVQRMDDALWYQSEKRVHLRAPFVEAGWHKRQIAELGNSLGVPWEMTWSCYVGGEEPCGRCGACVEREESLTPLEVAA